MPLSLRHLCGRVGLIGLLAASMAVPVGVMTAAPASAGPVPPTISSFTPTKGSFAGGTTVVITGTNLTGATSVKFGDDPAASFTVDSATQITAVTPAHAIGSAVVTVTRNTTATASTPFVFQPELSLVHEFFDPQDPGPMPYFVVQGPDGDIWVSSGSFTGSIGPLFRIEPDGTITQVDPPNSYELLGPLLVGPDGMMYATAQDSSSVANTLMRVDPTTGVMTALTSTTLCDASGLVAGGDGTIWITNFGWCPGSDQSTVVRYSPIDDSFTSFPVSAHGDSVGTSSNISLPVALPGNRFIVGSQTVGEALVVDENDGSHVTIPVCDDTDAGKSGQMIGGSIGPDGNLWMTCIIDAFSETGADGYLARVVLDPTDLANSTSTYYTSLNTGVPMGLPLSMAVGADGNLWVSQIYGPAILGGHWDLTAPLLRVSFPNGPATPLIEAFDSEVIAPLFIVSGADGYMYMNQFGQFAYILLVYSYTSFQCTNPPSAACDSIGLSTSTFQTLGAVFKIDVGTAPPPALDPLVSSVEQISLKWHTPARNGAGPITGYRIKYSTHADMSDATVINTGDVSVSRTLANLSPGTYYVRIATTNTIGTGAYSPVALAVVPSTPAAPTSLVATPGDQSASITFTAGSDGGSAIIKYQYSTDDGTTWTDTDAGTTSPVTISGLTNGSSYSIKLRAVNAVGDGAASTAAPVTLLNRPAAPTSLAATPDDQSASITFTAGSDGGSAIIKYQYSTDDGANWNDADPGTTSPVTVDGLTNYTAYSIKLRAVNALGGGAASAAVSVTPAYSPPIAGDPSVGSGSRSILATWSLLAPNQIHDRIKLYRARVYLAGTDTRVRSCKGGPTETSCEMKGLTIGTAYEVRVHAVHLSGTGATKKVRVSIASPPKSITLR